MLGKELHSLLLIVFGLIAHGLKQHPLRRGGGSMGGSYIFL